MNSIKDLQQGGEQKLCYFTDEELSKHDVPQRFTFPFYYTPHPLSVIAAGELQRYLETQAELDHNFGFDADNENFVIGKMFGVLVVADKEGRIGYLSGFSGKLAGTNSHTRFVPPVFDMLDEHSFFVKEKEAIDHINIQTDALLADSAYTTLKEKLQQLTAQSALEIATLREQLKQNKKSRDAQRAAIANTATREQQEAELVKQSLYDKRLLKALTEQWTSSLNDIARQLMPLEARIEALKNERKDRSAALQALLFSQYSFLNKAGERKSLHDIFSKTAFGRPPSAAGECATPKLLQYAFLHGYTPLAMAEFWWGASPKSEIRKHKQFYPACTGKCQPILEHMLAGMTLDDNPFLEPTDASCNVDIIYEDAHFVVVNKPEGLRSVPGVHIEDSVYSRLRGTMAGAEPLIVHRLDMGTSGLLVVAKTPEIHRHLQRQFLNRTVKKRYTALLSKVIEGDDGEIRLPLSADLFNRPRQLVDFANGKKSITRWKVVERTGETTRIHFLPLTGRTHQLRMHAAHELGLNAPIIGDDIYGTPSDRLYLHAAYLSFVHPVTKERVEFEVKEGF